MSSWLIVSIWGDPGGWSKVSYRVPEIHKVRRCRLSDVVMSGQTYSYKCTLGALLEAYRDKVSKSIVYVADTLAFSRHISRYIGSSNASSSLKSYDDIIVHVKHYINSILDDGDYINPSDRDKIEYAVLPGVGVYKRGGNGPIAEFTGSPLNYYYGLLFDLYTRLRKEDVDTIILDVSHGINFMPILGFNAVIEAVKLYALEKSSDVRLVVLNSDPVFPGIRIDIPRNMNIVFCRVYGVKDSLRELVEEYSTAPIKEHPFRMLEKSEPPSEVLDLGTTHGNLLSNVAQDVEILLKSINTGLPLLVAHTLEKLRDDIDVDECLNKLIDSVNKVVRTRRLESSNGRFKVKHVAVLNTPIEMDLKALVLLRTFTEIYGEFELKEFEYNDRLFRMYSLESMKNLVEKYMTGAGKIIASYEISDITMRVNAYNILCDKKVYPILYRYIYDFTEKQVDDKRIIDYYRKEKEEEKEAVVKIKDKIECPEQPSKMEEVSSRIDNERIFYAHAGFYGNITLVAVDDSKIYVGYTNDRVKDIVLRDQ